MTDVIMQFDWEIDSIQRYDAQHQVLISDL